MGGEESNNKQRQSCVDATNISYRFSFDFALYCSNVLQKYKKTPLPPLPTPSFPSSSRPPVRPLSGSSVQSGASSSTVTAPMSTVRMPVYSLPLSEGGSGTHTKKKAAITHAPSPHFQRPTNGHTTAARTSGQKRSHNLFGEEGDDEGDRNHKLRKA